MTKKQRQKRAAEILAGIKTDYVLDEPQMCQDCGVGIVAWIMENGHLKCYAHLEVVGDGLVIQKWMDIECSPF